MSLQCVIIAIMPKRGGFFTVISGTTEMLRDEFYLKRHRKKKHPQPSAKMTEEVLRRASLLGIETEAMLLLDHPDPSQCISQQHTAPM